MNSSDPCCVCLSDLRVGQRCLRDNSTLCTLGAFCTSDGVCSELSVCLLLSLYWTSELCVHCALLSASAVSCLLACYYSSTKPLWASTFCVHSAQSALLTAFAVSCLFVCYCPSIKPLRTSSILWVLPAQSLLVVSVLQLPPWRQNILVTLAANITVGRIQFCLL